MHVQEEVVCPHVRKQELYSSLHHQCRPCACIAGTSESVLSSTILCACIAGTSECVLSSTILSCVPVQTEEEGCSAGCKCTCDRSTWHGATQKERSCTGREHRIKETEPIWYRELEEKSLMGTRRIAGVIKGGGI